jgi:hypothetical protein
VNGVAQHQLAARKQLEIFNRDVVFLLVFERDDMPWRNGTVSLLPGQDVDPYPVARRVSGIGNLALEVAVFADPRRADGLPSLRFPAGFELSLGHPPRSPSGPAQSFVRRCMARSEPRPRTDIVSSTQTAGFRTSEIGCRLFQTQ